MDSTLGPATSNELWLLVARAAEDAGWRGITVDAFASESNARAPRFCSRLHEPGAEAIDALCVLDWSHSKCPTGGAVHCKITNASVRLCLLRGGGQGDAMEEN